MTKVMDKICKLRDAIACKDDNKLVYQHGTIDKLREELRRHFQKKMNDTTYELDFTSQDLRELAKDIHSMFKRWDNAMCPEKNIKSVYKKDCKDAHLDLNPLLNKLLPIIKARRENVNIFTSLLSMVEYYGAVLYFWEIASNDEFAINFTERLI